MSARARVCHTEDEEREMRNLNKHRIERDPSSTSRRAGLYTKIVCTYGKFVEGLLVAEE